MYHNLNMRQRKLVARMYVDMTYMDENKGRNLQFIYDRLAGSVLGISYKTFLDYLDEEKDSLDGITLPDYVLLGMWTSVQTHRQAGIFPGRDAPQTEEHANGSAQKATGEA